MSRWSLGKSNISPLSQEAKKEQRTKGAKEKEEEDAADGDVQYE